MEFLVSITISNLPEDEETVAALYTREGERARELAAAGTLRKLWRVPGQRANWGIWEASDPARLQEALSSLPLFPYMDIKVHPLTAHPNDPAWGATQDQTQ
jgi:muconolactone D-isomerase